ncbi:MAG: hypothetical protein KC589_10880, partial [Nanoarchaeota archaeon]|nr:hypothetical protein [Nanoarchaeota archaeon]
IYAFNISNEDKKSLIMKESEILFENYDLIIKNNKDSKRISLSEFKENLVDFFALLFFNNDKFKEDLEKVITKLIEIYSNLKQEEKDNLFSTMKLIGCWINYLSKIDKKIITKFNNIISKDLKLLMKERKDLNFKSIMPTLEEYGYFNGTTTYQEGYWLYPSNLWTNEFQENISSYFNSDLEIYKKYHSKLKELKSKK